MKLPVDGTPVDVSTVSPEAPWRFVGAVQEVMLYLVPDDRVFNPAPLRVEFDFRVKEIVSSATVV